MYIINYITLWVIISILFCNPVYSQKMDAYKIYDSDGSEANFEDLFEEALESNIVFFGETHNNPICHWLEFELTKALFGKISERLILGAEMFESDDQIKINEYLSGVISQKNFEDEAKLWNNYKTDYKGLVEFAKANKLKFIGTNIPRRYAALVSQRGIESLDSLSSVAKSYLAPLPIEMDLELPNYKKMEELMNTKVERGVAQMPKQQPDSAKLAQMAAKMKENQDKLKFFKQAQAVKDATMAHFILKNLFKDSIFIHYNGTYHTNNYEGIVWFIKKQSPNLKVLTIATVEQNDIQELEKDNYKLADFIIVIPETMTKTY